jgi:hypothetical protein
MVARYLEYVLIKSGALKQALTWVREHPWEATVWALVVAVLLLALIFVNVLWENRIQLKIAARHRDGHAFGTARVAAVRTYHAAGRALRYCLCPSVAVRIVAVTLAVLSNQAAVARFMFFVALIFLAYLAYDLHRKNWLRVFAVSALLLNPFLPLRVDQDTRNFLYLGMAAFLIISIGFIRELERSPLTGKTGAGGPT